MALAYLQIFADKEELLEPFDDAERGRLLTAMLSYALHDEEIELTGNERYIWAVFRQSIDQCKAFSENKRSAGRARHSKAEASMDEQQPAQHSTAQQKPADVQQDTAPASTPEQEEAKPQQPKAKRFTPPTVEDVQHYAQEHGYTLEADRFVDFYASKGWMVGKSPMRDWQAAVRGWAAKDRADRKGLPSARAPVKAVEQQRYSQRDYADHSAQDLARMMAEWGNT